MPGPFAPSPELARRILALDAENVTAGEVAEVLAHAPAPRLLNIHGGVLHNHRTMNSFAEFLVGMGYPRASIRNPRDGTHTFCHDDDGRMLAGLVAWHYERDGLRPMLVGHSLGGFRALEVLHLLSGSAVAVAVFDPRTGRTETRTEITDPLTGTRQPVVGGVTVSFAAAVASGGLGRLAPAEWGTGDKLRTVPDSVTEFTGFYLHFDPLGGDYLGFGGANHYHATGHAKVRNVRLPDDYSHLFCPDTKHLLKSLAIKNWINNYQPSDEPRLEVEFDARSRNILLAADVWRSIKRHWVLELQRLIRARHAPVNDPPVTDQGPSAVEGDGRNAGRQVLPSVIKSSNCPE